MRKWFIAKLALGMLCMYLFSPMACVYADDYIVISSSEDSKDDKKNDVVSGVDNQDEGDTIDTTSDDAAVSTINPVGTAASSFSNNEDTQDMSKGGITNEDAVQSDEEGDSVDRQLPFVKILLFVVISLVSLLALIRFVRTIYSRRG